MGGQLVGLLIGCKAQTWKRRGVGVFLHMAGWEEAFYIHSCNCIKDKSKSISGGSGRREPSGLQYILRARLHGQRRIQAVFLDGCQKKSMGRCNEAHRKEINESFNAQRFLSNNHEE